MHLWNAYHQTHNLRVMQRFKIDFCDLTIGANGMPDWRYCIYLIQDSQTALDELFFAFGKELILISHT